MDSEQSRILLDGLPLQVWTARPDGALDYVNRFATEYFQRPMEELIGDGWMTVPHPADLPNAVEHWKRSISSGQPYQVEFRLLRGSDRRYRWHRASAVPVRDENGSILRWMGANEDIDDLKRIIEVQVASVERANHDRDQAINALLTAQADEAVDPSIQIETDR